LIPPAKKKFQKTDVRDEIPRDGHAFPKANMSDEE
jgi:hypothetical protein